MQVGRYWGPGGQVAYGPLARQIARAYATDVARRGARYVADNAPRWAYAGLKRGYSALADAASGYWNKPTKRARISRARGPMSSSVGGGGRGNRISTGVAASRYFRGRKRYPRRYPVPKGMRASVRRLALQANIVLDYFLKTNYVQWQNSANQCKYSQLEVLNWDDVTQMASKLGVNRFQEYATPAITEATRGAGTNYFDPNDATIDTTTEASSRNLDLYVSRAKLHVTMRNGGDSCVKVMVYPIYAKQDHSADWTTCFEQGARDDLENNSATILTTPSMYPGKLGTKFTKDFWILGKPRMYTVNPGQEATTSITVRNRTVNLHKYMHHTDIVYLKARTVGLIIRQIGTLGHDTGTSNVGLMAGTLDVQYSKSFRYGLKGQMMRKKSYITPFTFTDTAPVQGDDNDDAMAGGRF